MKLAEILIFFSQELSTLNVRRIKNTFIIKVNYFEKSSSFCSAWDMPDDTECTFKTIYSSSITRITKWWHCTSHGQPRTSNTILFGSDYAIV